MKEGHVLSRDLAEKVMGWVEVDGFWFIGGTAPTGFRAARSLSDMDSKGFFRPDRNYFHVYTVVHYIETHSQAKLSVEFPSGMIKATFATADYDVVVKDEWDSDFANRTIAEAALELWEAAHGQA